SKSGGRKYTDAPRTGSRVDLSTTCRFQFASGRSGNTCSRTVGGVDAWRGRTVIDCDAAVASLGVVVASLCGTGDTTACCCQDQNAPPRHSATAATIVNFFISRTPRIVIPAAEALAPARVAARCSTVALAAASD